MRTQVLRLICFGTLIATSSADANGFEFTGLGTTQSQNSLTVGVFGDSANFKALTDFTRATQLPLLTEVRENCSNGNSEEGGSCDQQVVKTLQFQQGALLVSCQSAVAKIQYDTGSFPQTAFTGSCKFTVPVDAIDESGSMSLPCEPSTPLALVIEQLGRSIEFNALLSEQGVRHDGGQVNEIQISRTGNTCNLSLRY